QKRCNPLERVGLVFTAPVINEEVKDHVTVEPDLAGGRTDYDPWANRHGYSRLRSPHKQGRYYRVWLPEVLKAYENYHIRSDPDHFKDKFGRTLPGPLDLTFTTDHRRPDYTITHQKAVLEKAVDSEMPLVVTNLEEVRVTYDRLTTDGKRSSQKKKMPVPQVEDIAFRMPLQIRKMLDDRSGVIRGMVDSTPHVSKNHRERWFFVQVTPFHVHVKVGHFNTLVWVTDFNTGKPVPDATVKIYTDTYAALSRQPDILSRATTDANGMAMLDGTERIDPELKYLNAYQMKDPRFFVRIDKADDMALVPLDYPFRVDTYRASQYAVYPHMRKRYGHIHTWGTTAQGIYRAGDTVQFKFYVRNQNNETFVPAPAEGYHLKVIDPMGKTVHEDKDIVLSEFGACDGDFKVPKTGAVGWYRFQLSSTFSDLKWEPMRVLISDFTPAPFRVTTDLSGERFQPGDKVEITTLARLHAGGPYVDASTRVTVTLESKGFYPDDPKAGGFRFDTYVPRTRPRQTLYQIQKSVDNKGNLVTQFTLPDNKILFGRLVVESAVRDDRGKYISSRATAEYAGRDRFVGLRPGGWVLYEDKPAAVDVLVVDRQGKPVAGIPVTITIERRETKAARVKGAGNAFLTQYAHQWKKTAGFDLISAEAPAICRFSPEEPGSYRITATIQDTQGRPHSSRLYQWVAGKGRVVWEDRPDNSLEIIPEKKTYKVGEKARYLVKNPFPGAQALITIERYGVLKRWVQTLDTSTPMIEFDVEKDFIPGYFLSVVVMSPRVDKPLGDGHVDLGKPAFRMGYVKAPVIDPYKEIEIKVVPEKDTYKPRDRVKVNLKAVPRYGDGREPVELAVAVLDESVFDLLAQGKDYFDPYKGFYTIDGLNLQNFSLLLRLVGRQKFEKKGADTAGGGGADFWMRSLFKFVSYWNPSVIPDARGRARIEFEAPDNLTGWRVLAMAVTPGDRMGLGDGRFKVNRPTEIRPVMPNQVTEGDSFQAGFSIMNRTPQARELTVNITAEGVIEGPPGQNVKKITHIVKAAPYKRSTVWLPLKTTGDGRIKFIARGGDDIDRDGVVHFLDVRKRYSLETAATYGTTVSQKVSEPIHFPENIRTDVGRVSVALSPSVIGNLEGAFRYIRNYPYICWEQILTKGVMASHFRNLKHYMSAEFTWEGSERLPQNTLDRAAAYQAPNGGMTYYIPENRYVSPYLSAYTALAFNWLRESGYGVPSTVEARLHTYLLTLLRRNVVPDFYSRGIASTVRAVTLAALVKHDKVNLTDLRRYLPHIPEMSLFGKAHFLNAALGVPGSETIRKEVCDLILAHAGQSGGKFVFSETIDDGYTRILSSALRTNGAILSALVALARTGGGDALVGDVPFKLVRYITQTRKNRDHWENTQENMFCMNALIDYSRVYESEKPDMVLRAFFDTELMGRARFEDVRDDPAAFQRPVQDGDPGRRSTVSLEREGKGRLYYSARLSYAPDQLKADPIKVGVEIHREYSVERKGRWILLKSPMTLRRGELVRVDLFVSIPAARNFVVVDDPVPGGLEPVNRDLATASTVDADKGEFQHAGGSWWFRYSDWSSYGVSRWSFYHQELRHHAARFYSEYLPAGNYHLSYTAQAIAPGEFIVMPVHAEEMYDPDVFGKGVPAALAVSK
ncbi:MAG: large extracellular alpha-helical protein, partial [Deltaproteobacteria bacterium]|nr:large extracellular alpha-helical protein [Deltaproteobacteria bacterium]